MLKRIIEFYKQTKRENGDPFAEKSWGHWVCGRDYCKSKTKTDDKNNDQ